MPCATKDFTAEEGCLFRSHDHMIEMRRRNTDNTTLGLVTLLGLPLPFLQAAAAPGLRVQKSVKAIAQLETSGKVMSSLQSKALRKPLDDWLMGPISHCFLFYCDMSKIAQAMTCSFPISRLRRCNQPESILGWKSS